MGGKILLGIGILFTVSLFLFVNETSMLGMACYHVGQFSMQSLCIKPGIYRGAWLIAFVLIGFGAWRVFRASNKARAPQ